MMGLGRKLAVAGTVVLGALGACAPAAEAAFGLAPADGGPISVNDAYAVAIGDLDGDARPDLVVARQSNASIVVLLGKSNGDFAPAPGGPVETGGSPLSIAIGRLNGDVRPDIVTANLFSDSVSVLLGSGSGSVAPAPGSPVGTGQFPASVDLGDLNGDGRLDIVVANSVTDNVTVLLGNGTGGFAPAPGSPVAVGDGPNDVKVGNLNADANPDLAVVNNGSDNVTVLLGNGAGGFASAPGSPIAAGDAPRSIAIGDFDGDATSDLAVANSGSDNVTVLLGNGTGGFSPAPGGPIAVGDFPSAVALGDLNGDRAPDLAVTNSNSDNVSVLLGNGTGGFAPAPGSPIAAGDAPVAVAVGDLDGDAKPDLAVAAHGSDTVTVLLNTSTAVRVLPAGPIAFGPQPVSTLSGAQSIVVQNTGDAALKVSRARTTGADAADFLVAEDTCTGATVAVGSSCTVRVRFSPQTTGDKLATLTLTDDGPGGTAGVALTGTGDPRQVQGQEDQACQEGQGHLPREDRSRHARRAAPGRPHRRHTPGLPAGGAGRLPAFGTRTW